MAVMLSNLYDALRAGDVPDDKAKAAAEEVADFKDGIGSAVMSDQPNVAAMTAPQAQMRLDELQADPAWGAKLAGRDAQTYAEFHELSAKIAGVDLPASPVSKSAQSQLDQFTADPIIAKRLLEGEPETGRRFRELTEAVANGGGQDRVADLILGHSASEHPQVEVISGHLELGSREKMRAIEQLRESGIGDGAIMEAFGGTVASPTEIARAKALRTQLMDDKEWCAKLLAGNFEQRRQLRLLSIILANS
jgi:hypothetical protein